MSFGRLVPTRHATTCKNDSKFSVSFVRVNPSLLQRKGDYLLSSYSLYLEICLASIKIWTTGIYNGLLFYRPLFLFEVMINATLSLLLGTGHSTFMQERVPLKPKKVFSSPPVQMGGVGWSCFFVWILKTVGLNPVHFCKSWSPAWK